jgi:choline dehydrogenase-like flavoprotein
MMSSPVEADVIVIGGGTAGLVLAARLSEDANIDVLVLEAGLDQKDDPRVKTPALWPGLVGTESDWGFVTLPQVRPYRYLIE